MLQLKIGRLEFNRGPYNEASCLRLACDVDVMGAFDSHQTRDRERPLNPHRTVMIQKDLGTLEKDTRM